MKTSVWILGDQLVARHPAVAVEPERVCVVMVESAARVRKLPYQRKKLVLLFSAMRHYAQGLREQGYEVDYRQADTFLAGLRAHVAERRPDRLFTMAAADWNGRSFQNRLAHSVANSICDYFD